MSAGARHRTSFRRRDRSPQIRELRRLFYCGEWIESHGLHVFMLHAPGLPGLPGRHRHGAGSSRRRSRPGLELKKYGNDLVTLLGGREIHPVSACVGRLLSHAAQERVAGAAREVAPRAGPGRRVRTLGARRSTFRTSSKTTRSSHSAHPDEYPFNEGRLTSNRGLNIDIADYDRALPRAPREAFQRPAVRTQRRKLVHDRSAGALEPLLRPVARLGQGAWQRKAASSRPILNPFKQHHHPLPRNAVRALKRLSV